MAAKVNWHRYGAKITAVSPYLFDGVHTGVT